MAYSIKGKTVAQANLHLTIVLCCMPISSSLSIHYPAPSTVGVFPLDPLLSVFRGEDIGGFKVDCILLVL